VHQVGDQPRLLMVYVSSFIICKYTWRPRQLWEITYR